MTWLKNLALGAAAFLAMHAVEVHRWREWFDASASHVPWFLNNGRAATLTMAGVAVAAAVDAAVWARSARNAGRQSLDVAGGAALAMTITLFVIGPGSIFPIVLVAGAGLMTASAVLGGWLGFAATCGWRPRLDRPEPP
ncbi:MAG TPA: hypothetical protein VF219_19605 [Vicinamibacterales bacterium]